MKTNNKKLLLSEGANLHDLNQCIEDVLLLGGIEQRFRKVLRQYRNHVGRFQPRSVGDFSERERVIDYMWRLGRALDDLAAAREAVRLTTFEVCAGVNAELAQRQPREMQPA